MKKFRKGIQGLYKKQKRQDWDHKAYHDAPSAIIIMCMSLSSLGNRTIYSTWCIMICLVIPILSLYNPYIPFLNLLSFFAAFSNYI